MLVVLLLLGLTGIYLGYRERMQSRTRLTIGTPAQIVNVETIRVVDPVFGNEKTAYVVVSFTYNVGGIEYSREVKMDSAEAAQHVPWESAVVCYDPADQTSIEKPELFPANFKCGE